MIALKRLSYYCLAIFLLDHFTRTSTSFTATSKSSKFLSSSTLTATTTSTSTLLQASAKTNEGFVTVTRSNGEKEYQLAYRIVRPMALSSQQAAPIIALHGGPSVPSNYLYPLEHVVPYRSIIFYDQLGCGKSDEPNDISLYSIQDSIQDLKLLIRKLGIKRFHLYGQSYGGILAFEFMKTLVEKDRGNDEIQCLSAILSSSPTNVKQVEKEADRLIQDLMDLSPSSSSSSDANEEVEKSENVAALFRRAHQCRLPEMPQSLADAYANAGTVWRGTDAIKDYVAVPPPADAARMPSTLIMRGEFDFVSSECVANWKCAFNTKFLRYKTLQGCSHHGLLEKEKVYGDIVDSYFSEYD